MQQITTKDNSITYYNEQYQETYHSTSGAEQEAIKKFVEPAHIQHKKQLKILDICFGLGYNTAAAIDAVDEDCVLSIVGLENDKEILNKISTINSTFKSYEIIKSVVRSMNNYQLTKNNINIKLILGDACKTIKVLDRKFDLIFLDPFSPKKCPRLWTLEFFKNIAKLCKKGAILTTYSCARAVRDNLKQAGFRVKDGPCIGRRAPSTIAIFD